jgi:gliding motility-associated lipoprotein GldD
MTTTRKISLLTIISLNIFLTGCKEVPVPKPKGYFRIDLPEKNYIPFNSTDKKLNILPITFEYPSYGILTSEENSKTEDGWFNIEFPRYKAKIYLTYKEITNDFNDLMEQNYKMNIKNHITKADAISEQEFNDKANKVYGILYDLKGNTATAVQFYVTDSLKHYLRGSLYFSVEPAADSLAPVISFFRDDMVHIVETLRWKNN